MKIFETDDPSPSATSSGMVWEYRSDRPFGPQLFWHVEVWGTKPEGSPSTQSVAWARKDFAKAIGRTPQGVGQYYKNEGGIPSGVVVEKICSVLFGENQYYNDWKADLLKAYANLKKIPDQNIAEASQENRKKFYFNAPPTISEFHGREVELKDLEVCFFDNHSDDFARVAVIHGFSGLGKSALATEFVHRYRSRFRGVIWLRAETRDDINSGFARFGKFLGQSAEDVSDPEVATEVALSFLSKQTDPWLIVFDELSDRTQCKGLLLRSPICTLITSHFSDWTHFGKSIPLEPFSLDEAAKLLQYLADRDDATGANKLARVLGRLPLALNHAAVTCRRAKLDFLSYAENAEALLREPISAVDYPKSVYVAIKIALDQISHGSQSRELLWFLAHCNGFRIEADWAEGIFGDVAGFTFALMPLTDYSLVRIGNDAFGKKYLTVHNLVQSVARSVAAKLGVRVTAAQDVFESLYLSYEADKASVNVSDEIRDNLNSHLISLLSHSLEYIKELDYFPDVMLTSGLSLLTKGSYILSDRVLRKGHQVCTERLSSIKVHPWVVSTNWEQLINPEHHDYFHSPKMNTQELEMRTYLNDFDVVIFALLQIKLSLLLEVNIDELLFLQERLLAFSFISDGPASEKSCVHLCQATTLYLSLDKKEKAAKTRLAARFIFWSLHNGKDFVGSIFSKDLLNVLFDEEAEKRHFLKSQFMAARKGADLSPLECIKFMESVAQAQQELGDHFMAFRTNKAAYFAKREMYGVGHPKVAHSYFEVGMSVIRLGKGLTGMKICEKSLEVLSGIYSSYSPFVITARNNMLSALTKSIGIPLGSIFPLVAETPIDETNPDF